MASELSSSTSRPTSPPQLSTLTPRQAERRDRVVLAALGLAAEGGYDSVQMRAVAERSEVAIGTVYHYFSSKDHLLASALLMLNRQQADQVAKNPPTGDTTLARMRDLLGRMTDEMGRNPQVSAALMNGFTTPCEENIAVEQTIGEITQTMLSTAFPHDHDEQHRDVVIRTIEHVWYSGLIAFVNGWMPLEQATTELDNAVALLLADLP